MPWVSSPYVIHLGQMAPVAARRESGKSSQSPLFGESQSHVCPPSVDIPINNSSTPKSTTPLSAPVGKKQRTAGTAVDDELAAPNMDWVSSFAGKFNVSWHCHVALTSWLLFSTVDVFCFCFMLVFAG
jgi:hypothetical protein